MRKIFTAFFLTLILSLSAVYGATYCTEGTDGTGCPDKKYCAFDNEADKHICNTCPSPSYTNSDGATADSINDCYGKFNITVGYNKEIYIETQFYYETEGSKTEEKTCNSIINGTDTTGNIDITITHSEKNEFSISAAGTCKYTETSKEGTFTKTVTSWGGSCTGTVCTLTPNTVETTIKSCNKGYYKNEDECTACPTGFSSDPNDNDSINKCYKEYTIQFKDSEGKNTWSPSIRAYVGLCGGGQPASKSCADITGNDTSSQGSVFVHASACTEGLPPDVTAHISYVAISSSDNQDLKALSFDKNGKVEKVNLPPTCTITENGSVKNLNWDPATYFINFEEDPEDGIINISFSPGDATACSPGYYHDSKDKECKPCPGSTSDGLDFPKSCIGIGCCYMSNKTQFCDASGSNCFTLPINKKIYYGDGNNTGN